MAYMQAHMILVISEAWWRGETDAGRETESGFKAYSLSGLSQMSITSLHRSFLLFRCSSRGSLCVFVVLVSERVGLRAELAADSRERSGLVVLSGLGRASGECFMSDWVGVARYLLGFGLFHSPRTSRETHAHHPHTRRAL